MIIIEDPKAENTKNQFTKSDPNPPSLPLTNNLASSVIPEKTPRTDALIKYSTKN